MMKQYIIDKMEMQRAVEENDENKIYFFFSQISKTVRWKHHDMDDWRQEAISRAFRYLPSYNPSRGLAFSYFYRIIVLELAYQYRKYKKRQDRQPTSQLTDDIRANSDEESFILIENKYYESKLVFEAMEKVKGRRHQRERIISILKGEA